MGNAGHEVGDLRNTVLVTAKIQVLHRGYAIGQLLNLRVVHLGRQSIAGLLDLRQDLGHGPVGVGIKHQLGLDFAAPQR